MVVAHGRSLPRTRDTVDADLAWVFGMALLGRLRYVPEVACRKRYYAGSEHRTWTRDAPHHFSLAWALSRYTIRFSGSPGDALRALAAIGEYTVTRLSWGTSRFARVVRGLGRMGSRVLRPRARPGGSGALAPRTSRWAASRAARPPPSDAGARYRDHFAASCASSRAGRAAVGPQGSTGSKVSVTKINGGRRRPPTVWKESNLQPTDYETAGWRDPRQSRPRETKSSHGFHPPSSGPGWAGMAQVLGQFSDRDPRSDSPGSRFASKGAQPADAPPRLPQGPTEAQSCVRWMTWGMMALAPAILAEPQGTTSTSGSQSPGLPTHGVVGAQAMGPHRFRPVPSWTPRAPAACKAVFRVSPLLGTLVDSPRRRGTVSAPSIRPCG